MKLFEIISSPTVYRGMGTYDFWAYFLRPGTDVLQAHQRHKLANGTILTGVSFTRNKQCTEQFGQVRITADLNVIRATNKVIPVDAEYLHYLSRVKRDINDPVARKNWSRFNDRSDGTGTHEVGCSMAEEFVVGDIKNFSRCIEMIEVLRPGPYQEEMDAALDDYSRDKHVKVVYRYD